MPSYYEFHCPVKILCGHNALPNLPYELQQLGARRPLVVTDAGVVDAGLLDKVTDVFVGSDCEIGAVFDRTPPNSSIETVNELAALYRERHCDSLAAVGGGSALDTAKGVNIVISEGTDDLMQFQGVDRLTKPARPLVTIPTTAGTGSEVTSVAVITDTEKGIKLPFMDARLFPHVAILDPVMTVTMPPKITAATGMDALTHAVEAFYCLGKNPVSDAYSVAAIELILKHLPSCVQDGSDPEERLAMANAALLAGIAFSNSLVGVVHSLAHACGGIAHVPHGVANSVLLPFGMENNLDKVGGIIAELAPILGADVEAGASERERAEAAIQAVRDLGKRLHELCGAPTQLRDAGVKEEQLEAIAKAAINDGAVTYNPEEISYEDALRLLRQAF
jgi:alcohol dehydrogenase